MLLARGPERARTRLLLGLGLDIGFFGHVCSFDSLHHMHAYAQTLAEMARVLAPGGRAVFVEPGAQHSRSPETVAFLRTIPPGDPDWIERDVVLEEIDAWPARAGFGSW